MLITKLDQWFMDFELMNALGIMYPEFWMQPDVDLFFTLHMVVIKKHYCKTNKVKPHCYMLQNLWMLTFWICKCAYLSSP